MSCKLEPAICSPDTGQQIPCFDRCQLIIAWMSNIKEVHGKPRLHDPVNLLFGVWPPCCMTLSLPCVAPTSNTASHDSHEKINSWVSFSFLYQYGAPLGGPLGWRSSTIRSCPSTNFQPLLFEYYYFTPTIETCQFITAIIIVVQR